MGEVYLARDQILDREVAIKVLRRQYAGDSEFAERFKREALNAASLSHPNIVQIYDRGQTEQGAAYIAMEYVPGGTLKEKITREGPLETAFAASVGSQVAEALGAAHAKGVVHRDIKPQNVLLTGRGEAKVADFGIARAASAVTISQTGSVMGTAGYMSPEQALGKPATPCNRSSGVTSRGDPCERSRTATPSAASARRATEIRTAARRRLVLRP